MNGFGLSWPALDGQFDEHRGGIPLVLGVDPASGKLRFAKLAGGGSFSDIGAWTSRVIVDDPSAPAGEEALGVVMAGHLNGAYLYGADAQDGAPPGTAVYFRPKSRALNTNEGSDGLLVGVVTRNQYALSVYRPGLTNFRLEVLTAGSFSLQTLKSAASILEGDERMVVNARATGRIDVRDAGRHSPLRATLGPGEAARFRYTADERQWEDAKKPLRVASVLLL